MDDEQLYDKYDLGQALIAWTYHMKNVEHYSASTIKGKAQEATRLTNWLLKQGLKDAREINAEWISGYAISTYGHLGDKTHNLYLSHLRLYIAFLRKKRLLGEDQNPEVDLMPRRRPVATKVKTFVYPENVMEKAEKAGEWHLRDKYYVIFTFYMARRAGEACVLQWKDIDLTPRPGYKFGFFQFRNNKIGGELKKRPINPKLLPYVIEWQKRYQELLTEQFGLTQRGQSRRKIKPTDFVFPPIDVGPGRIAEGARRPLVMFPERQLPYSSIWRSLTRAGIRGIHGLRRGGMIDLKEDFGLDAARVMADHKTLEQSAEYMDIDRESEGLGDMFAKKEAKRAKRKLKKQQKAAATSGVPNLKDHRPGARRAS